MVSDCELETGGSDLFLPEPNLAGDVKAGRRCSASLCNIIPPGDACILPGH